MEKEFKFDIAQLADYICPEEPNLPIHGMLDIYRAIGLYDFWANYLKEHNMPSADPKEYLACNFATLTTLKGIIQNNWETFNIDITDNNNVIWKPNDLHTRRKRGKKVRAKVRNSILYDFGYYSPALDDEVDDDIILFREPIIEEIKENVDNQ